MEILSVELFSNPKLIYPLDFFVVWNYGHERRNDEWCYWWCHRRRGRWWGKVGQTWRFSGNFFFLAGQSNLIREAWWHRGWCAWLWIKQSGYEPWLRTLCRVHGLYSLFSQCLPPPSCINGYWLTPHPGGSRKTPSHFMPQKLRYVQDWMLMRFKFLMIGITKSPHW